MKLRLAITLLFCLFAANLAAQSGQWVADSGWCARQAHATVEFNNRLWVLGGRAMDGHCLSDAWSSPDGAQWTCETINAGWSPRMDHAAVVLNGRIWVMGGGDGWSPLNDIWSSDDGVNWTLESAAAPWSARAGHTVTVFNGELWLLGGREAGYWVDLSDAWSSPDGINWTQQAATPWPARSNHGAVVLNNQLFILGGTNGFYFQNDVWSYDGNAWALVTDTAWSGYFAPRTGLAVLEYSGLMWAIGGQHGLGSLASHTTCGEVLSSPDGINWTMVTTGFGWADRADHSAAVFNGSMVILGGLARQWNGGLFGNGAPGEEVSDVWSSTNGMVWSKLTGAGGFDEWAGRTGHAATAFNGKLWVLGGGAKTSSGAPTDKHDVWSSVDGASWVQETAAAAWSARAGHGCEVLNGELWVLGGRDASGLLADAWHSSSGASWNQGAISGAMWSPREAHATVAFQNKLWVLGGYDGAYRSDVWSSPDGVTWSLENAAPGWSARGGHSTTVFNNRIWVMGGHDAAGHFCDVWSSADGVTWTLETSAPGWDARFGHASAVAQGRLWVTGGKVGALGRAVGDVWSSADGINWVQESNDGWSARGGHTLTAFNGELRIMGGLYVTSFTYAEPFPMAEVWSYRTAPLITSSPVTTATAGNAYAYTIATSGSACALSASGLPAWLSLSGDVLSGTPGGADVGLSSTITITASNPAGSDSQSFQIDVAGVPGAITSTPVTSATAGVAYAYTVATVGGLPAPVLSAAGLPGWLSFDPATGLVSGTPGVSDIGLSGDITITASNGTPPDAEQVFQILVAGTPAVFTSTPVTEAFRDQPYSYTVTATGLPVATFTASALPAWLSFDTTSGLLSGTPSVGEVGDWPVEITADTGWWAPAVQQFTIHVPDPLQKKGGSSGGSGGCTSQRGAGTALTALLALLLATTLAARLTRRTA